MATIQDFVNSNTDTICIDWEKAEEEVGFRIHQDLKDFYTRLNGTKIGGKVNFIESKFLEKTGNEEYDTWISSNECEGNVEYCLNPIKSLEHAAQEIKFAFQEWTGGNDFGHRALIGEFFFNIGEILILFNNDTGNIEWVDCGYGYFDVYEENPNGILAKSMQSFLEKLCSQ